VASNNNIHDTIKAMMSNVNPTTSIVVVLFLPLVIAGGSLLLATTYLHNRRSAKSGIAEIDQMDGQV
jgi:hypothetical protein